MKKIFLTLLAGCICLALFAQDTVNNSVEIRHFMFDDFLQGTVKKKTGELINVPLNYNTLTEEMIFERDSQRWALQELETIEAVYVNGKVFIPVGNVFYEKATNTPVALYIEHKTDVIPPKRSNGYTTTDLGAIANVSQIQGGNKAYDLAIPTDYKLTSRTTFWIKKGEKYIALNNIKKLQSIFPEKAASIKDFAKANNISFDNADDLVKLVVFCN